jgi:hypothetical protein
VSHRLAETMLEWRRVTPGHRRTGEGHRGSEPPAALRRQDGLDPAVGAARDRNASRIDVRLPAEPGPRREDVRELLLMELDQPARAEPRRRLPQEILDVGPWRASLASAVRMKNTMPCLVNRAPNSGRQPERGSLPWLYTTAGKGPGPGGR